MLELRLGKISTKEELKKLNLDIPESLLFYCCSEPYLDEAKAESFGNDLKLILGERKDTILDLSRVIGILSVAGSKIIPVIFTKKGQPIRHYLGIVCSPEIRTHIDYIVGSLSQYHISNIKIHKNTAEAIQDYNARKSA